MQAEETSERDTSAPFSDVLTAINKYDPEGLLAIGAPQDEYEAEAADLADLIRSGRQMSPEAVLDVWERWFGPESWCATKMPRNDLESLAVDLSTIARSFPADQPIANAG